MGDQLVQIQVYVPTKLSAKDRQLLEELDRSENIQPQKGVHKTIFEKFKDALNI